MKIYGLLILVLCFCFNVKANAYVSNQDSVLLASDIDWDKKWTIALGENSEAFAIKTMLSTLMRSQTAKKLIDRARLKAKIRKTTLENSIFAGAVSITDSTVVRRFSSQNPTQVEYELQLKIYLNRDLSFKDAMLDLAHELEHFAHRPESNPYEHNKSLHEFIVEMIEGEGGEGAAVYKECMIAEELFGLSYMRKSSCLRLKENDHYQWSLVVENFYRVGEFFDEFTKHFRPSDGRNPASDLVTNYFPQLAKAQPVFVSSAYGMPYPLAAIMEYNKIEQTVCQNEQKRLGYLKQMKSPSTHIQRTIASVQTRCP
jgi:hypothetical protein